MKKTVILILGLIAAAPVTAAAPVARQFSAAALYNRANAEVAAGHPAMAVLNYERGLLLAPEDPDITANLRFVRESAHLSPPYPPPSWMTAAVAHAVGFAGPTAVSWVGVGGLLLFGMGLVLGQRLAGRRWRSRGAIGVGALMMSATILHATVFWRSLHAAVVMMPDTPARVTPVPMGEPLFVLAEADTVQMQATHEDFVLVKTATGNRGWVSIASLAPVVPP